MIWHETRNRAQSVVPDLIQDITFRIEAKTLPLDHASALSDAVLNRLPWLKDEPQAGIHLINYPESGSGWTRQPDSPRQLFFASKRLRLRLRLPKQCLERAKTLIGQKLDLDGHTITIGQTNTLLLVRSSTLFARRVIFKEQESESDFIERVIIELDQMGITPQKILCGRHKYLQRHANRLSVRSVMLADLEFDESIRLQQNGLGPGRLFGCGIFIPHKSIGATKSEDE